MKHIAIMAGLSLICLTAAAQPAPGAGQKAYISDRLNLGMYLQPDPAATPVKSLPSGMQVEVLETRDGFARIRMVDGNEGWARAEFITTEIPAKVQLQQVTRERDRLREQLNAQAGGEQQLSTQMGQATAIAVMPLTFTGADSNLVPLERGFAELLTIDLARSSKITVVERARIQALKDELAAVISND
jgi:hypothetical protein